MASSWRRWKPISSHNALETCLRELRDEYSGLFCELKRQREAAPAADGLEALDRVLGESRRALADNELRKLRLVLSRRQCEI